MDNGEGQPGRAYFWPLYQGTKQLKAQPMTKADYCQLRGWTVPADEDPAEPGYVVEYQDGGKPNLGGFAGYVSWSPADVFERAYKPCGSHIERMEIEFDELHDRLVKLADFIEHNPLFQQLPDIEGGLLQAQRGGMNAYRTVLSMRLERAKGTLIG